MWFSPYITSPITAYHSSTSSTFSLFLLSLSHFCVCVLPFPPFFTSSLIVPLLPPPLPFVFTCSLFLLSLTFSIYSYLSSLLSLLCVYASFDSLTFLYLSFHYFQSFPPHPNGLKAMGWYLISGIHCYGHKAIKLMWLQQEHGERKHPREGRRHHHTGWEVQCNEEGL